LPLVKWFLAIPHYIVLAFLVLAAIIVTLIAWLAILFTGTYPEGLFNYVVVMRWCLRVQPTHSCSRPTSPPFKLEWENVFPPAAARMTDAELNV
jgi:hypothetical protein